MYQICFHPQITEDLIMWFNEDQSLKIIDKIYCRLRLAPEPDGRTVKRLYFITVPVFFEYKVRRDLRIIFYKDDIAKMIKVLGCIRKNVTKKLFDKRLDLFLKRFYNFE